MGWRKKTKNKSIIRRPGGLYLSRVHGVDFFLSFLIFLPFFDFDLDIVCFILPFSCGYYAVSSVSVSAATRLAYYMYLGTYVRWSHLFIFWLRYTICFSYCVYYLRFFICFSSGGNIPHRSYWSLPCDHGLHCNCLLYTSDAADE